MTELLGQGRARWRGRVLGRLPPSLSRPKPLCVIRSPHLTPRSASGVPVAVPDGHSVYLLLGYPSEPWCLQSRESFTVKYDHQPWRLGLRVAPLAPVCSVSHRTSDGSQKCDASSIWPRCSFCPPHSSHRKRKRPRSRSRRCESPRRLPVHGDDADHQVHRRACQGTHGPSRRAFDGGRPRRPPRDRREWW